MQAISKLYKPHHVHVTINRKPKPKEGNVNRLHKIIESAFLLLSICIIIAISGCEWDSSVYSRYVGIDDEIINCSGWCDISNSEINQNRCTDAGAKWLVQNFCSIPEHKTKEDCESNQGIWKSYTCNIDSKEKCDKLGGKWFVFSSKITELVNGRYLRKYPNGKYRCGLYDDVINFPDGEPNTCLSDDIKKALMDIENGLCSAATPKCIAVDKTVTNTIGMCTQCTEGSALCRSSKTGMYECFDLRSNNEHCGSCEKICSDSEYCQDGECKSDASCDPGTPEKPTGLKLCRNTEGKEQCTSTFTDPDNCGDCGIVCPESHICKAGRCEFYCGKNIDVCPANYINSTTNPNDEPFCTTLKIDPNNCGECGKKCDDGLFCSNGKCSDECAEGETKCTIGEKSTCVDLLGDNHDYCGACNKKCKKDEVCRNGRCEQTCTDPQTECTVDGSIQCIDTNSDSNHCGNCDTKCDGGKICSLGVCQCPSGQSSCGEICVDLKNDHDNCRKCGYKCADNQNCVNKTCVTQQTSCTPPLILCATKSGKECVDPSNTTYCGCNENSRGTNCNSQMKNVTTVSCNAGKCTSDLSCSPGYDNCNGDPNDGCETQITKVESCGSCNFSCLNLPNVLATSCVSGSCNIRYCSGRFKNCNNNPGDGCETDISTKENCGDCNNRCKETEECCGTGCTDLKTNKDNCGKCGNSCNPNEDCSDGVCVSSENALTAKVTYNGVKYDAYRIASYSDLQSMRDAIKQNKHWPEENTNDIFVLTDRISLNIDEFWESIGTETAPFKGMFFGKPDSASVPFPIDGTLKCNTPYCGLFGKSSKAVFDNIILNYNFSLVFNSLEPNNTLKLFGGLVCELTEKSIINHCQSNIRVSDDSKKYNVKMGGLVAIMTSNLNDGGVFNSSFDGSIASKGESVGGIAAEMNGGMIENTYTSGIVERIKNNKNLYYAGGIVGKLTNGKTSNIGCTGNTTVKSNSNEILGGLIGLIDGTGTGTSTDNFKNSINITNAFYWGKKVENNKQSTNSKPTENDEVQPCGQFIGSNNTNFTLSNAYIIVDGDFPTTNQFQYMFGNASTPYTINSVYVPGSTSANALTNDGLNRYNIEDGSLFTADKKKLQVALGSDWQEKNCKIGSKNINVPVPVGLSIPDCQ